MKTKLSILSLITLLTLLVVWQGLSVISAAQGTAFHCDMGLEATIYQGPSAGLAMLGDLQFDVEDDGSLIGSYILEDGSASFPIAGQVNGRAINLIITVAEGQYIYGVGTALNDIISEDCGTAMGGPFVGPEAGDSGQWEDYRPKGRPGQGTL
jgi:hypothetical protein